MDTDIKMSVKATDTKAQYDNKAKQLLGHKIILAYILVNTVAEFKGMKPADVVQYIEGEPYIGSVPVDALVLEDSVPAQVDSLKIYYTGHDNRFYTDRCVGRSNRDLSISTEGLTLEGAGVHYLWLSCDVAPDALRGRHVTTRLAGVRNGHNFLRSTVSRLVDRRIG